MTPLVLVQIVFGIWITINLLTYVSKRRFRRHYAVFARAKFGEWLGTMASSVVLIFTTITVGILLIVLWPSVLGWTWLMLLARPEEAANAGQNLNLAPAQIPYVGLLFVALLALSVPRFARYEEEQFRRGTKGPGDALVRSVKFGLVHCIVGVPIGLGLALTIPGLWFTYQYRRGGVRRAVFVHSIYNWLILIALAGWLVWR
ncbi:MAG TPA: hypothetical protein PLH94_07815 [Fimbriimonadaceae bacterium]|nr:hypothetical protein [Fimbriimonadaceae bacterium]